jgi:hypothetical protein
LNAGTRFQWWPYHLDTNPQWRSYNHSWRIPWWHCRWFNGPHVPLLFPKANTLISSLASISHPYAALQPIQAMYAVLCWMAPQYEEVCWLLDRSTWWRPPTWVQKSRLQWYHLQTSHGRAYIILHISISL